MTDENKPVEENESAESTPPEGDAPAEGADAKAAEEGGDKGAGATGGDLELEEMEKIDPLAAMPTSSEGGEAGLEAIYDIPVTVAAVLGTSKMHIHQLLKLGRGAVVELDRKVGEAIDIYVNDRLVARGEIVIVEDKLGVTMTEIVKSSN
jgi:flagellar motor switch protein FliN/FliY